MKLLNTLLSFTVIRSNCVMAWRVSALSWPGSTASFKGHSHVVDNYATGRTSVADSVKASASLGARRRRLEYRRSEHGRRSFQTQQLTSSSVAHAYRSAFVATPSAARVEGIACPQAIYSETQVQ